MAWELWLNYMDGQEKYGRSSSLSWEDAFLQTIFLGSLKYVITVVGTLPNELRVKEAPLLP